MLNIINDLVDISRIEAGQIEFKESETNVNQQLEYIHKFFYPEVEKKGIEFLLSAGLPDKDSLIVTDREKLYAIITNLIKNAIKFTRHGLIEFGYKKIDRFLQFFVRDTGIGISPEKQKVIFERFIQVDNSLSGIYDGVGLGLAISKAFVKICGGDIWVESSEGDGTTFYFTIPYLTPYKKETGAKETSGDSKEKNDNGRLRILLVEDDEVSVLLMKTIMKKYCSEIVIFNDGASAVETIKNDPEFDLILMDIRLPILNGYEATKQIREFNKEIIIIAQTAFGFSSEKEKTLKAGCNDYISKPIQKSEIAALMHKYFGIKDEN